MNSDGCSEAIQTTVRNHAYLEVWIFYTFEHVAFNLVQKYSMTSLKDWFCWLINQPYPNIYLEHNSGIGQATCPWTNNLPIMNFAWGCSLLKINYFRSIASMLLMPWLPFSSMLCFTNCSVALSTETGWLVCHVINVNVLDRVC